MNTTSYWKLSDITAAKKHARALSAFLAEHATSSMEDQLAVERIASKLTRISLAALSSIKQTEITAYFRASSAEKAKRAKKRMSEAGMADSELF